MDNENPHQELVKCVVVGDTAVGKTRLIRARACDASLPLCQLLTTHIPTVWAVDQYRIHKEVLKRSVEIVDGVNVSLRLWDTFGDHDKDRRFAYGRSDVVLLCFSISNPISLRNCKLMWYPEIRQFCPNTPIVLVGCKNDLRYMYREEKFINMCKERSPFFRPLKEADIVSPEQGRLVAKEIGAPYYESSVLTTYGVTEVFENVIRAALLARKQQRFWMTHLKHVQYPLLQEPFCPPKPLSYPVTIPPSEFAEDICLLLENQWYTDIIFLVGRKEICAQKLILASASCVFFNLLTSEKQLSLCDSAIDLYESESSGSSANTTTTLLTSSLETVATSDPNKLSYPFKMVCNEKNYSKECPRRSLLEQTIVTVADNVCSTVLLGCLRFLYCGDIDAGTQNKFTDLQEGAKLFDIPELQEILNVIKNNEDFARNELQKKYIEKLQNEMKNKCLDAGLFADVLFQLDDGICEAHRCILVARCDVMAAMFSGDFRESMAKVVPLPGVSKECFKQVLIYLYTDKIEKSVNASNCLPLLELANRLCLPRLVALVEQQVILELIDMCQRGIDTSECSINLLEPCQIHNADQLADWCLHNIAVHYSRVCLNGGKLLRKLHPENQAYLNKNRWPPLWYIKEYGYYEQCLRQRQWQEKPPKPFRPKRTSLTNGVGCLCFRVRNRSSVTKSATCSA